jgi:hypothetical protein
MTTSEQDIKERVLKAIGDAWPDMDEVTARQNVAGHHIKERPDMVDKIERIVLGQLYQAMATRKVMPLGISGPEWWRTGYPFEPVQWALGKPTEMELGECVARAITIPVPKNVIWPPK